jgi:3-hydroxyacyl-CoA dehydrogenase/enoyl-CoA hydratase/3-hydroxybutyryl-CoA epimerase
MALEAYKCVEEGVVGSPTEADVGSIVAGLMPAYTGGALSYIDVIGVAEFVNELEQLAESVGPRFAPTEGLRAAAENGTILSP